MYDKKLVGLKSFCDDLLVKANDFKAGNCEVKLTALNDEEVIGLIQDINPKTPNWVDSRDYWIELEKGTTRRAVAIRNLWKIEKYSR